jgi:hypothetical protein
MYEILHGNSDLVEIFGTTCAKIIGWEGVDWIHLAQIMEKWRVIVNTAMIFQVP